jgi:hypothetical protein
MGDFDPDAYLASSPEPAGGSFDPDAYLADFNPDAYLADKPAPEGAPATFARRTASAIVPAAGAVAGGALAGAGAAALYGAPLGPIGSLAAGAVGALAGGYAASKAQDVAKDFIPGIDDRPQLEANAEAHPVADWAGELVPFVGNPAGTLAQRGVNAGVMGAFSVGQQAASGQGIDPKRVGADMVFGGVFPGGNRATRAVHGAAERMVPGRPNMPTNPAAERAHADVDDPTPMTAVEGTSLAEPPPETDQGTIGRAQDNPTGVRSSRVYAKYNSPAEQARYAEALSDPEAMRQFAHEESLTEAEAREIAQANYEPSQGDMLTQGQMDPATAAAMEAANPPAPEPATAPQAAPSPPQPAAPNAAKPTLGLKPRAPAPPEPVVDAGFPKTGEPVAVGENEATPMPQREVPPKLDEVMNRLKGKTNPNPTEGQKEAGNYEKARERLFDHEVAYENMKGSERTGTDAEGKPWSSTLPADYGYFRKTVGADKDHVDVYNLRNGDKNFIVDQRNPDTGKFDEHKVMANAKDLDDARDTYLKAFSDEKGLARLHDITEVSPDELTQWLKGASKKKPYGAPVPQKKARALDRKPVQDFLQKLRDTGRGAEADKIAALPDEQVAAATAKLRNRNYGVKGGYPVEGLTMENGEPVTANTKAKAAERTKVHQAITDWFKKSAPPAGEETNGALLDRIKGHSYPTGYAPGEAGHSAWVPTFKPKEWLLAREAKNLLYKRAPGQIKKFREAERLLRGSDEDVQNYRGGNRIDADIANSKRSGDKAVGVAENQRANEGGLNTEEDKMAEYLDTKRAPGFDVPNEEAEDMVEPTPVKSREDLKVLPRKTVDASDTSLTKIDTNKISKDEIAKLKERRARAEASKARAKAAAGERPKVEANIPSEERKTNELKKPSIDISDPARLKELIEASNKAAQKKLGMEARSEGERDLEGESVRRRGNLVDLARDMSNHFLTDERASMDVGKIKKDFNRLMQGSYKTLQKLDPTRLVDNMKKTEHGSFHAKNTWLPREDYVRSLDEKLYRVGKVDENYFSAILNKAQKEWKGLDSAAGERIFRARDADSASVDLPGKQAGKTNVESLPPEMKALYDKHLDPVFSNNDQFKNAIRAIDKDKIGPDVPHHVAHIMNGDTSEFNMLREKDDPLEQGHYRGLSTHASAAEERKYVALDRNADRQRFIVEPTDKGYDLWENGKVSHIRDPDFKFEDGKQFTVTAKNGKKIDYTMHQAMAEEKEKNVLIDEKAPKYFKDARFAALVTNAQLGSMARHMAYFNELKNSKKFEDWTTTNKMDKRVTEKGWATTNMPNMDGIYMHPDLKALFDDFAGNPQNTYQKLNAEVTKLIFLSPTAHFFNVLGHFVASRGWDNLSIPKNMAILHDLPFALQSVLRRDRYQRKMNLNGSGTVYGKLITKDMPGQLAKAFGLEIERDPSTWGPIADKLGVPLLDLKNSLYRHSSEAMWAGSDMLMTLRVRELQRKGMPMQEAVINAERDIPNYRTWIKIMGNRFLAEKFFNSAAFAFSRYHSGMIRAYANLVSDMLGKSATAGDRVEAVGKLMAIGLMGMVAYPLMDKLWQKVTGNPNAEASRRGPNTIPSHIAGALNGEEDIMSPVRAAATVSPLLTAGAETFYNRDWRGKDIVKPGDVREGARGHVAGIARAVGEGAEHLARGLVAPYNMYANTAMKAPPGDKGVVGQAKILGRTLRDQTLDIKDVSDKSAKYKRMVPIKTHRDVTQDYKKGGGGPFGGLINSVFGR